MSPPGASFPEDIELPHVAAPAGGTGVPAGEGCYNCDINHEGIPLERPLSNSKHNDRPLSDGRYFHILRTKRNAQDLRNKTVDFLNLYHPIFDLIYIYSGCFIG